MNPRGPAVARGESWKYHYFSGTDAPPPLGPNQPAIRTPPAKLREVQIVAGPDGAIITIDDNGPIIIPPNFSFKTNCFCDVCCNHYLSIVGDTLFWFVSYCQPQGNPSGFPCPT